MKLKRIDCKNNRPWLRQPHVKQKAQKEKTTKLYSRASEMA